jgi:hypothetical protein
MPHEDIVPVESKTDSPLPPTTTTLTETARKDETRREVESVDRLTVNGPP